MTIRQAIFYGECLLREKGVDQPRWNSERLLVLVLQEPRSKIYTDLDRELNPEELSRFSEIIEKRAEHYPLAYLEGIQDFFGREFSVNKSVLIPRPETEELIRAVLSLPLKKNLRILDIGSGSGIIPITLALEIPGSFAVALEISPAAISVLRSNLKGNVKVIRADFRSLCFKPATFDFITANLPYVEEHEFHHLPAETVWEPEVALRIDSLEDSFRCVMMQSAKLLKPDGYLVMEIGFGQSDRLAAVAQSIEGLKLVTIRNDKRGIPRVLLLQSLSSNPLHAEQ